MSDLAERVLQEVPQALDDLVRLVAIPSVSSDPAHADDVARCAEVVAELLRAEGVTARVVTTGGARPAVLGRKEGPPGAPTVLLYAHHDVQPTGPLELWSGDPFVAEVVESPDGPRLRGRGTSDDKGAVALQLAVLRAFGDDLPVTVVVLVEGEEEIGSPGFAALLATHADELDADVLLVPDAVNNAPLVPSLTTGLRGILDAEVTVTTLTRAVHSGLYGGVLPCALTTLVELLATLRDPEGGVAVEGLAEVAPERRATLVDLAGLTVPGVSQTGEGSLAERLVGRPSVSVLGLDAVPVAQAGNVLHPTARAKVGVRLPPGADPEVAAHALERHLREHVRHGADLQVQVGQRARGFACELDDRARAVAAALLQAYGAPVDELGVGGSIPFVTALADRFPAATVLVTAIQDPASAAHAADETLHLAGFARACVGHALALAALGQAARVSASRV